MFFYILHLKLVRIIGWDVSSVIFYFFNNSDELSSLWMINKCETVACQYTCKHEICCCVCLHPPKLDNRNWTPWKVVKLINISHGWISYEMKWVTAYFGDFSKRTTLVMHFLILYERCHLVVIEKNVTEQMGMATAESNPQFFFFFQFFFSFHSEHVKHVHLINIHYFF